MHFSNFEYKGPPVIRRTFLFYLKYLGSFIWPLIVEKQKDKNGNTLKLEFEYGKLVVNTGDANYSYGNLQKAFEKAFDEYTIPWSAMQDILILGFGSGSIAQSIRRRYQFTGTICGIEQNEVLLDWYHKYFPNADVRVHARDAGQFICTDQEYYDLIVVDLFEGLHVPEEFLSDGFLESCKQRLREEGMLIFNIVVEQKAHREQYADLLELLSRKFKSVHVSTQMDINRIIFAK